MAEPVAGVAAAAVAVAAAEHERVADVAEGACHHGCYRLDEHVAVFYVRHLVADYAFDLLGGASLQ